MVARNEPRFLRAVGYPESADHLIRNGPRQVAAWVQEVLDSAENGDEFDREVIDELGSAAAELRELAKRYPDVADAATIVARDCANTQARLEEIERDTVDPAERDGYDPDPEVYAEGRSFSIDELFRDL